MAKAVTFGLISHLIWNTSHRTEEHKRVTWTLLGGTPHPASGLGALRDDCKSSAVGQV